MNTLPTPTNLRINSATARPLKAVVFSVGTLNCAFRLDPVYKVVTSPQLYGSQDSWVGLTHLGDREVTVLDINKRLFPSEQTNDSVNIRYLIVVQNQRGELYGIPVEKVPVLMDIPFANIRVLPETFRQANALGIASHVAVVFPANTSMTLFLLDIESLTRL
ncbi:MAG: chemotaxis protein CheW [Cyanosarcina radialis HA8281-LM2]|nr:chemotaxis protein CheW [Cyanosarcina radialis HA8281-LM2]